MKKDYGEWHKKKKILNERKDIDNIFFREKEVWWIALGVNIGFEQDGKGEEFPQTSFDTEKIQQIPCSRCSDHNKSKKDNKYYIFVLLLAMLFLVWQSYLKFVPLTQRDS